MHIRWQRGHARALRGRGHLTAQRQPEGDQDDHPQLTPCGAPWCSKRLCIKRPPLERFAVCIAPARDPMMGRRAGWKSMPGSACLYMSPLPEIAKDRPLADP